MLFLLWTLSSTRFQMLGRYAPKKSAGSEPLKENTMLLLTAEIGLCVLAIAGLCTDNEQLAYTASGAFVGVLAGHINGRQA